MKQESRQANGKQSTKEQLGEQARTRATAAVVNERTKGGEREAAVVAVIEKYCTSCRIQWSGPQLDDEGAAVV